MKLKLIKFSSVKSTNDEAIKLIKKNKFVPCIISAKSQTKGRGTMGKKWVSKKGNLFVSLFFEIDLKNTKPNKFSVLNPRIIKNNEILIKIKSAYEKIILNLNKHKRTR